MKTPKLIPVIVLAAFAISATADNNDAVKKDLAALQGEWSMTSGSSDGQSMPDDMRKQMKRVCTGNELTVTMSGRVYFKAKITIDPSSKPKTIDYEMTEGISKGKKQLGVYEISGDSFKACMGTPGGERPGDFSATSGQHRLFSTWKREKESAAEQK